MSNPIAICVLLFCTIIFTSQIFLEYYLYLSQIASEGGSSDSRNNPEFINSNLITGEEVQRFIQATEDKITFLNHNYAQKRQNMSYRYKTNHIMHLHKIRKDLSSKVEEDI